MNIRNLNDVKSAIQSGTIIEAKDEHNKSALHKASEEGQTEIIKLLLDAGADIDAKDNDGCQATQIYSIGGIAKG